MTPLERLKMLTLERDTDDARLYTDEELMQILHEHDGDVRRAAYDVLLRKSRASNVSVAGVDMPDTSAYFLRLAASVRDNATHPAERADVP